MNALQKYSVDLQAERRRQALGLAADCGHSARELRELWRASLPAMPERGQLRRDAVTDTSAGDDRGAEGERPDPRRN